MNKKEKTMLLYNDLMNLINQEICKLSTDDRKENAISQQEQKQIDDTFLNIVDYFDHRSDNTDLFDWLDDYFKELLWDLYFDDGISRLTFIDEIRKICYQNLIAIRKRNAEHMAVVMKSNLFDFGVKFDIAECSVMPELSTKSKKSIIRMGYKKIDLLGKSAYVPINIDLNSIMLIWKYKLECMNRTLYYIQLFILAIYLSSQSDEAEILSFSNKVDRMNISEIDNSGIVYKFIDPKEAGARINEIIEIASKRKRILKDIKNYIVYNQYNQTKLKTYFLVFRDFLNMTEYCDSFIQLKDLLYNGKELGIFVIGFFDEGTLKKKKSDSNQNIIRNISWLNSQEINCIDEHNMSFTYNSNDDKISVDFELKTEAEKIELNEQINKVIQIGALKKKRKNETVKSDIKRILGGKT